MKTINIRGTIGYDVLPVDIEKQLEEAKGEPVKFVINSPGGLVYAGLDIFNMIKKYPGKTSMHISSIAGSMASVIALAGSEKPTIENNSTFFIHNAQGYAGGDHNVMFKLGNLLKNFSNMIAKEYARVSKKSLTEIKEMMDNETYFIGKDIIKNGFANNIIGNDDVDEDARALAMLEIEDCIKFVKTHEMNVSEIDKIVALYTDDKSVDNNPATTRENTMEEKTMNFTELMAANPAAITELNEKLKMEKQAGFEAGKKSVVDVVAQASKFLSPESKYPSQIKNLAVDVIKGEKPIDSLTIAVAIFDSMQEANKSLNAQVDTSAVGETPGQNVQKTPQDDVKAQINRDRASLGMEAI